MWRNILGQALYQIAWLLVILFSGKSLFNLPYSGDTPFLNGDNKSDVFAQNKTIVYTILF